MKIGIFKWKVITVYCRVCLPNQMFYSTTDSDPIHSVDVISNVSLSHAHRSTWLNTTIYVIPPDILKKNGGVLKLNSAKNGIRFTLKKLGPQIL